MQINLQENNEKVKNFYLTVYFVNHNFTKSQKHFAVTDGMPTFASWRISELISTIVDKKGVTASN